MEDLVSLFLSSSAGSRVSRSLALVRLLDMIRRRVADGIPAKAIATVVDLK